MNLWIDPGLYTSERGWLPLDIFDPVSLYNEIAHVITPFTLVAIAAETIYRYGGDDKFFDTPRHALVTGSVIGVSSAQ